MKVEGPGLSRLGRVRRTSGAAPAEGFAEALEGESAAATPAGVQGLSSTLSVGSLLALQGENQDEQEKRAKARGEDLLRQLELLRLDLLTGAIPRSHLTGLAQTVKTAREQTFDPRLNEILDEIELRAAVELAKYDPS